MKKTDCECLNEKICSRIHNYGAKKFSYAGRLVLVKAVLSSLHSYWASMFVIPKGIISRIEATCRNFLWDSCTDYRRVPMVAWEKICRTKEEGGLGLKDQGIMNKAMIGRLVHWITTKKDSLWVKWVQANYLKGREWLDYIPSTKSSWVWRRICKVKEEMLPGYATGIWGAQSDYSTKECYEWFKGSNPKMAWFKCLWNDHVIPKHQFTGWLVAHGALRTRDKLVGYGMDIDDQCLLCAQETECTAHLLGECIYSKRVLQALSQKVRINFPVNDMIVWCTQRTGTTLQKGMQAAMVWGVIYHIWQQRNRSNMEGILLRPERVAEQVIEEVKARVRGRDYKVITKTDLDWLRQKNLYVLSD
ncbi:uncharacterized protein LOC141607297 [Silene latifolia]|uniref:uncharacterized protein LOC141607297 n=1 Tax=Silene latifolia TaxID=37657 RepID=UPI003D7831F9